MIKITTIEDHRTFKPKMGFRNGKVVALLYQTRPWKEIEITPSNIDFSTAYVEELGCDCLRVAATLAMTLEMEQVMHELIAAGLAPKDVLTVAKEKGRTQYGMIIPSMTEDEFMGADFMS
jgi:hypothetical protein